MCQVFNGSLIILLGGDNYLSRSSPSWLNLLVRFWGDFAAGVSVASVLIPQSMSYATSLGHLDASTGLFSAAIPGAVYALFGTSPHLNVGPEAALSLLIGMAISGIVRGDPHSPAGRHIATSVATVITFQVFSFSEYFSPFMCLILNRQGVSPSSLGF
jgi:MFS superfamily sulfate permease-like transporter